MDRQVSKMITILRADWLRSFLELYLEGGPKYTGNPECRLGLIWEFYPKIMVKR